MKRNTWAILYLILCCLASCTTDPKRTVESYIANANHYDKAGISKVLNKNTIFQNTFLNNYKQINIDSFKNIGGKVRLLSISAQKGVVRTTEVWTSTYDSLLGISPQLTLYNTYLVKKGQIESIIANQAENLTQYKQQHKREASNFEYYLNYEYPNLNPIEKQTQLINLLIKYNELSNSEKKEYAIRAYIKDSEFVSTNSWFKMGLKFKGKSTVLMTAMGFTFPTTYTLDEDQLTIVPISGSLPMPITVKDANTMIGESIQGEYVFKRVNRR